MAHAEPAPLRRAIIVLWPAFLMAAVAELFVFAMLDPQSLTGFGGRPLAASSQAVYTLAFFFFWGLMAVAAAITHVLGRAPEDRA